MPEFESKLVSLQDKSNIPGMAAGIYRNGQTFWVKLSGYANKENSIPVTALTIFHLASITKTFSAIILVQLADEGLINLNDPVRNYGIQVGGNDTIRIKHLLTRTSEGIPGTNYHYNGDRFALLDKVVKVVTGKTIDKLITERITQPYDLAVTSPSVMTLAAINGFDTSALKMDLVQGYSSSGFNRLAYPQHFSSAAGLISSITDMMTYAAVLDDTILLKNNLKEQLFTPAMSLSGETFPYGLGWFVQYIEGKKIVWHYGLWTGISSLIIKVPEQKITFVVLANSDMLSSPYPLGAGDLLKSPYAKVFLNSFVLQGAKL